MSFGFSVGDIIALVQLTTRAYDNWKNACGEYAEITGQLNTFNVILKRLNREATAPQNLFQREDGDYGELLEILENGKTTVTKLSNVVIKFKSLGRSRKNNWDRMRLANNELGDMRSKLSLHIAALTVYLNTLGVGALGRIERDVGGLCEMRTTIDNLAAQIRAGKREGSVMTVYEDDDQTVWRGFRRELISEGFSSASIQKHKSDLLRYLRELHQKGLLEEEAPPYCDNDTAASFDDAQAPAYPGSGHVKQNYEYKENLHPKRGCLKRKSEDGSPRDGLGSANFSEESVEEAVEEEKPWPRRGTTSIPGRVVSTQVLYDLRYTFHEEGDTIVVEKVLSAEQIDEVFYLSKSLRDFLPGVPQLSYPTKSYDDPGYECSPACEVSHSPCHNSGYWHARDEEICLSWSNTSLRELARGYELELEVEQERLERMRLRHLHAIHHDAGGLGDSCDFACEYYNSILKDVRPRRIEYNIPRGSGTSAQESCSMIMKHRVMSGVINTLAFHFEAGIFGNSLYYQMVVDEWQPQYPLPPAHHGNPPTLDISDEGALALLQRRSDEIYTLLEGWYEERSRCQRCCECW